MAQAFVKGTRLEFVVVPLEGEVKRNKRVLVAKEIGKNADGTKRFTHEIKNKLVTEPAGYMVYFPRGHALRIKDEAGLRQYGLDRQPRLINLDGLSDPNSPIGQLIASQDDKTRRGAMSSLEQQVVQLASLGGQNLLTRDEKEAA